MKLFSVEKLGHILYGNANVNRLLFTCEIYYTHICILSNSAYVLFKLILKLSDEFEIMLST